MQHGLKHMVERKTSTSTSRCCDENYAMPGLQAGRQRHQGRVPAAARGRPVTCQPARLQPILRGVCLMAADKRSC